MFDGVQTKYSSLLPILDPEWASQRIVDGILKEENSVIFPWFINLAPILKSTLPPKVYDQILTFFGVNSIMENFKGRH